MAESYGVITEGHSGYIISLFITYGYGGGASPIHSEY